MPRVLAEGDLLELTALLERHVGTPSRLRAEQDQAGLRDLGISLPREAELWFCWSWPTERVTPLGQTLSLAQAVQATQGARDAAPEGAQFAAPETRRRWQDLWPPSWLAFAWSGGSDEWPLDCADKVVAPLRAFHPEFGYTPGSPPLHESLGDFVALWADGLRNAEAIFDGRRWRIIDTTLAARLGVAAAEGPL